jgi:class 3 adenylate cyclase
VAFFKTPLQAARAALEIRDCFTTVGFDQPLPTLNVRIGLHAAPIYVGRDPIQNRPGAVGAQVSLTARIEPIVEPGKVYATDTFVALLNRECDRDPGPLDNIAFDELGELELAKGWGKEKLFALRWVKDAKILPPPHSRPIPLLKGGFRMSMRTCMRRRMTLLSAAEVPRRSAFLCN